MTKQPTNGKLQSGDNNNPEKMKCIKCGSGNLYFYDGALGYESIKCKSCNHDQQDPVEPIRIQFLYRDAHNYKTYYERSLERTEADTLEVGQMIKMGEFRTHSQNLFFDSLTHPHPYNDEYDHNLLEIVSINSIGFESEEYCSECDCVFRTEKIISECPQCHKRVIACNACRNCGIKCQFCTDASMFSI